MYTSWWALEEVTQIMWPLDDLRVRPGQSEAPYPFPCLWDVCCPWFPQQEPFSGIKPFERAMSCWDHLDWIHDWTQGRSPYKLLTFWWWVGRSIHLAVTKTSLIYEYPCLFNLPPTNLECSAFLLSLLAHHVRGPICKATVMSLTLVHILKLFRNYPSQVVN